MMNMFCMDQCKIDINKMIEWKRYQKDIKVGNIVDIYKIQHHIVEHIQQVVKDMVEYIKYNPKQLYKSNIC